MRRPTRLIPWISGILLVVIVIAAACFLYDQDAGFGTTSRPAFVDYKPMVLTQGIKITGNNDSGMPVVGSMQPVNLGSLPFAKRTSNGNGG